MSAVQRLGRIAMVACSMLLAAGSACASAQDEGACADILSALGRKPPGLEFVGCTAGHDAQLRVLVASYRVQGRHAARVERYLVRNTGMARLRFVCCGWEPGAAIVGGAGRGEGTLHRGHHPADSVTMVSGESLVSRRADWAQITVFQVRVTRYLESP